jgi:DtxR family Mn-dependent transcriptional regulator
MVKKLAERGLVAYTPYKGAELTAEGASIARTVLRRRRLWAVFLADHLGLSAAAADAVACEFEHITPSEVAQQLAHFLGDPVVGPGGKPIPAEQAGAGISRHTLALVEVAVGRVAEIVALGGDPATRSFLEGRGIEPGARVTVLALSDEGDCLVETARGHVHVSGELARVVSVTT